MAKLKIPRKKKRETKDELSLISRHFKWHKIT
jgi:hypothetical protein